MKKAYNITFPILLDRTDQVSQRYRVQAIPTTYFVNKRGVIVDKSIGLVSPSELHTNSNDWLKTND